MVGKLLRHLSEVLRDMDEIDAAKEALLKSINIGLRLFGESIQLPFLSCNVMASGAGEDHEVMADSYELLGSLEEKMENHEASQEWYRKALRIQAARYGSTSMDLSTPQ